MTAKCMDSLAEQLETGGRAAAMIGFRSGGLRFTDLTRCPTLVHEDDQRPLAQPWMDYRSLAAVMTG
jgi:6-phosphofructokinase 1